MRSKEFGSNGYALCGGLKETTGSIDVKGSGGPCHKALATISMCDANGCMVRAESVIGDLAKPTTCAELAEASFCEDITACYDPCTERKVRQ